MKGVGWGTILLTVSWGCSEQRFLSSLPTAPPPADLTSPASDALVTSTSALSSPEECQNPVVAAFPADGSVDVYAGSSVWFTLTRPDPGATLTLTDATGRSLAGKTTFDGANVTWTGEALSPSAMYVATLATACGTHIAEFTTSCVGTPLTVDPTGTAYAVNVTDAVWFEARSIGQALSAGPATLLVSPLLDDEGLDLLSALGTSVQQDACRETSWMTMGAWEDPTFSIADGTFQLTAGKGTVALTEVVTTGAFFPDGSGLQLGRLVAEVDTREVIAALSLGKRDDLLCTRAAGMDPDCHACADGGEYCATVVLDGLSGVFTAVHVTERTAEDIAHDRDCR